MSLAAPATRTLGMRLDDLLNEADNMSTSQLYGLIVAATVGFCIVLLGTGSNAALDSSAAATSTKASSSATIVITTGKQPRWHIFKYVNYVAISLFAGSVALFGWNASYYLERGNLATFLVGWSLFLCYFFAFFGVSFIYNDIPQQEAAAATPVLEEPTLRYD